MADWAPKRFWTETRTEAVDGGWQVLLDARAIRTPAQEPLILPTKGLAHAIADEWEAQREIVDPTAMPMTRTANSAIDKVAPQHGAVVAVLADYASTDLLSYRADGPRALVIRQSQLWDPLLDWARERYGAELAVTEGVMPVPQDATALNRLTAPMLSMSPFQLAAFHDLVALSGSLVLALAAAEGAREAAEIWELSRLDEEWQAETWGRDEEADAAAARKGDAFLDAHRFYLLSNEAGSPVQPPK